jgi:hypothetical protein
MAMSKSRIVSATDTKLDTVNVPEWGGEVCLKTLTGSERDSFEESYSGEKMKNFRCRFLVLTLCDENGERLFADDEVEVVGKKSALVINRLFEKAWQLNAFSDAAVDALGKDSPSDQSDVSTSN